MLLGIDVGNTNTVIGALEGLEVQHLWRVSTIPRTTDEFGLTLIQLLKHEDMAIEEIEGVAVCCVVPSVLYAIEKAVRRYLKCDVLVVGRGIKTGMRVRTDNPREVGADRIVNAVAAFEDHGGPLVVVDFGTATPLTASAPRATTSAARSPRATRSRDAPSRAPRSCRGYRSATGSGHRHEHRREHAVGSLGLRRLGQRAGSTLQGRVCRATALRGHGGLARLIGGACDEIDDHDEHLTLKGLRILWERNGWCARTRSPLRRSGVPSGHGHPVRAAGHPGPV